MSTDIETAVKEWQTQGWTVVHDLVPAEEIDAAVEELWGHFPHPSDYHSGSPEALAHFENESTDARYQPSRQGKSHGLNQDDAGGTEFRLRQFLGHVLFPYDSHLLNRLQVHPRVVDFAQRAMGSEDIRLYQARIWGKYLSLIHI